MKCIIIEDYVKIALHDFLEVYILAWPTGRTIAPDNIQKPDKELIQFNIEYNKEKKQISDIILNVLISHSIMIYISSIFLLTTNKSKYKEPSFLLYCNKSLISRRTQLNTVQVAG